MTPFKLRDLKIRFRMLQSRIAKENRDADPKAQKRLADFLTLNPYDLNYAVRLDELLEQMPDEDELRDNILLEKAISANDILRRSQLLTELVPF